MQNGHKANTGVNVQNHLDTLVVSLAIAMLFDKIY